LLGESSVVSHDHLQRWLEQSDEWSSILVGGGLLGFCDGGGGFFLKKKKNKQVGCVVFGREFF